MLNPESAVFYSTNRGWPWGAPDYVWPGVAQRLLDRGLPVLVVTHPENLKREEIRSLQRRGATCLAQPPLQAAQPGPLGWRTWAHGCQPEVRALKKALTELSRPHVFINQGGDFDLRLETDLLPFLQTNSCTYDVIIRSTRPKPPFPKTERLRILQILTGAHRCYFNSDWSRKVVETKLAHRIENGELFSHPIRFQRDQPLPWPKDSTMRLACVNRLDVFHKGLDVLLEALSTSDSVLPPWSLEIFGKGPDEPYLRDLIHWFGLEKKVTLMGHVTDLEAIWRKNHLLVLTSRYEGFGVSMLEAMACGRPVLRTPYGGCREWITDGQTGYICPAPEPELIATTLRRAADQSSRWKKMGAHAFLRCKQQPETAPDHLFLAPFSHLLES